MKQPRVQFVAIQMLSILQDGCEPPTSTVCGMLATCCEPDMRTVCGMLIPEFSNDASTYVHVFKPGLMSIGLRAIADMCI